MQVSAVEGKCGGGGRQGKWKDERGKGRREGGEDRREERREGGGERKGREGEVRRIQMIIIITTRGK